MPSNWQQSPVEMGRHPRYVEEITMDDSESASGKTDQQWTTHKTQTKVDLRILPVLLCLGVVVALDGSNFGQARTRGLEETLQMKGQDFSIASMVYFLPAVVLAVPSNIVLHHFQSPPWFFAPAVVLVGVVTVGEGLSLNFASLVACRLLSGIFTTLFEAGAINLLAAYYLGHTLHKRITLFLATRLLASAFGGLLAFGLAQMDGIGGLQAWRWIFIIEGLLTVLVGAISFPFLPMWPEQAVFCTSDESSPLHPSTNPRSCKTSLVEHGNTKAIIGIVLRNPLVYFSALIHFCCTTLSSSLMLFLPTIFHSLGWSPDMSNYMTVPVFLTGAIFAVLNGAISDRLRLRYPSCATPLLIAILACVLPIVDRPIHPWTSYAASILQTAGNFAAQTTSLTWLGNNLYGRRSRGIALGFVAGFGNLGFVLGPYIYLDSEKPIYMTGRAVSLAMSILALVSATAQLLYLVRRRKRVSDRKVLEEVREANDSDVIWLHDEDFRPGKIVF